MKIETTFIEDHQAKLRVEVDDAVLQEARQRAARQIARKTKIPGFRPGKAPFAVVERFAGPAAILEEALDILVQDLYPKAIDEAGIKPYGPGKLLDVSSTEPPVFEFSVPLEAEVTLGDYRSLRRSYKLKEITDQDVEAAIEDLRSRQAVLEPANRPAQEGDQVVIRLGAVRTKVEGDQQPELIREKSTPLTINKEPPSPTEWPFPGFSRHLLGLPIGAEKSLNYTYPDDSVLETLRGTSADFHFVVEEIKARILPELTDEFAHSVGEFETLDALRQTVRASLETQEKERYEDDYFDALVAEVISSSTFKYPPQMLDREVDEVLHQLEHRLANQNMDIETYLKVRQIDKDALRKETIPVAEQRIKRGLVLYEIAAVEKIDVPSSEVEQETIREVNYLSQALPQDRFRQVTTQNEIRNIVGNITANLLVKHTLLRLKAYANEEPIPAPETETSAPSEDATPEDISSASSTSPEPIQEE